MSKTIKISDSVHYQLGLKGNKNDTYNDIIQRLLEDYDEYHEIKDLIEADEELEQGKTIHFNSLTELEEYLED
ncbi:hypothetical protein OTK55_06515 [Methanosphaera sp. Vir-13MRS]|uniref:hypothetical protein n=1 Tax=Candidatus Methanosphaera massiliense TaxID=3017187 RepID=UPI0023804FF1|nr:hypothetical protein [Candidatus Methanosphaera massiliense]MDE4078668.1 hypothetical protein [Candidatus Methanosphaera massiliense]